MLYSNHPLLRIDGNVNVEVGKGVRSDADGCTFVW